jgi:acyl-CoA synthetase (AMP-forming)/AMP-acid ligase II
VTTGSTHWVIADVWEAIARARPAAACIAQGGRRLTWTEFNQQANDFAQQLLDSGLGHQGKLGLALRNCPEFLVGAFACLKVGLVPVNTNFRYTAAELINIWNASDAESVVFSASIAATVAEARRSCPRVQAWYWVDDAGSKRPDWARSFSHPPASPQPESSPSPNARAPWGRSPDDLILLYTGGTTGVPKGVMWRQDDVFAILNATAATPQKAWTEWLGCNLKISVTARDSCPAVRSSTPPPPSPPTECSARAGA